jgi:hypothetical protein
VVAGLCCGKTTAVHRYEESGMRYEVSGMRYEVSGIRYEGSPSDIRLKIIQPLYYQCEDFVYHLENITS